ncbi:NACHT domain protein [Aspergillus novoparasiticus]|uniref:NACHT domain protein n=1 Tax=Aspergillus novoparasiticus TaxID=986946 RepID=A0A5N6E6T1_9EURO|nr:NACHT domain protein [Aspergillus novoparasiticus]
MGCGKTVAMSYLVDVLSNRNQRRLPEPKLCYYYCRDDKTGRATSIVSALILSLLEQLPGLKRPFFEWYKEAQASGTFDPAASMNELAKFLERLLQMMDRPVILMIDGLDECDRVSRRSILHMLETLLLKVQGLKTLLSTRPEQEILEQLGEIPRIELDSDTERDAIVAEKLIESQLSYLSTDVRALVLDRLSHSAQGSAIWTKMMVELIEVRRIQAIDPMRRFLESIPLPEQLSHLYATLFSRCTSDDFENQELAGTALKLLAVTHRPFSILELAWAVTLGVAHVTTVDALAGLVDHQRIMSLIHPFVARVDPNDVERRQVRLVHQSVKEFIMETCISDPPFTQGGPFSRPGQLTAKHRLEYLNAFILDICIRYLLLDDIGNKNLFSEEQVGIAELPQGDNLFEDDEQPVQYDPHCTWESWEENMIRYDPTERGFGGFFVYASCHWVEYFSTITVDRLPSLGSIENLCQAGSARLSNWIQQNCRPDCAIIPRFEFESSLYDPLSITSLYGSEAMLRDMVKNSNFDNGKFLQETAMAAADQILHWGDISRLKILFFDDKLGHQLQTLDFFRLVLRWWPDRATGQQDWATVFCLIDHMPEDFDREMWRNELLSTATNISCAPVLRQLE